MIHNVQSMFPYKQVVILLKSVERKNPDRMKKVGKLYCSFISGMYSLLAVIQLRTDLISPVIQLSCCRIFPTRIRSRKEKRLFLFLYFLLFITVIFDRRAQFLRHTWYDNPSADNSFQSRRHPGSSPPAFPAHTACGIQAPCLLL